MIIISPSRKYALGFNLIEAAIVLGVIGLIIGGIWVAAAAINERMKVNETLAGVMTIINNVNRNFPARDYMTGSDVGVLEDIAPHTLGIRMGIPPTDWVNGNIVYHPFGGPVRLYVQVNSGSPRGELWLIYPFPSQACVKFTTAFMNSAKVMWPSGAQRMTVGASPSGYTSYSDDGSTQGPALISILCGQDTSVPANSLRLVIRWALQ